MSAPARRGARLRSFLAHHLYSYLAGVAGVVVLGSILLGRRDLGEALRGFDKTLLPAVLGLSLVNYGLRLVKWQALVRASELGIHWRDSARIFLACFTMVVTPARLGEVYKLLFLRRLHGIPIRRSTPVLVVERISDAVAVFALAAVELGRGPWRALPPLLVLVGALLVGSLVNRARPRELLERLATRTPLIRRRAAMVRELLLHHARLLAPSVLGPVLVWSTLAWFAECVGLRLVVQGLGAHISLLQSTWIYALSTALGNLTFLPGGLGGTEASMIGFLKAAGLRTQTALAATALIRASTLWFAVFLGLLVSWLERRALQWRQVREESASFSEANDAASGRASLGAPSERPEGEGS